MSSETNVVAALAAWNTAIGAIEAATADIRAGRNVAMAKQRAEAAIRVGSQNAMIVGQATWFTPPVETQQNWERSLVDYQAALQAAGLVTPPATTPEGVRIGNVIVPWATIRNVVFLLGAVAFGIYWMGRQHGKRK